MCACRWDWLRAERRIVKSNSFFCSEFRPRRNFFLVFLLNFCRTTYACACSFCALRCHRLKRLWLHSIYCYWSFCEPNLHPLRMLGSIWRFQSESIALVLCTLAARIRYHLPFCDHLSSLPLLLRCQFVTVLSSMIVAYSCDILWCIHIFIDFMWLHSPTCCSFSIYIYIFPFLKPSWIIRIAN